MSKKLLKEPSREPPKNPLETQNEPQNAGGSAARKEDVRDSLDDIKKFQQDMHYFGQPRKPENKKKFPLGEP